ncbi:MAG: PIN domain-containing protein [Roseburia sp.]|nr:PIN domain-containing protein [Roseburia sp.]
MEDSSKIFKLCEVKKITGFISALSIPNIVYIMRKELDAEKIKDIIEKLTLVFGITELKGEDLKRASQMEFADYEDAVQSCQASRIKADYIVTRNIKDYKNSKVMAIKPAELLERL